MIVLRSPAKVNLYLDVLRKRPDGYHDIETIFEKIELFDTITIRPYSKGIKITTDNAGLPADSRNLAYKAASLLFKKARFKGGVWIDIKKKIPVAAGLGGGSSNAATTLSGINKLFKLGFGQKELIALGKQLGADIPFFLYDAPLAVGTGKGDAISPLYNNINIWHIIVTFNFEVLTKEVYAKIGHSLKLTPGANNVKMPARPSPVRMNDGALPFVIKNDIENLGISLYNRMEEAVLARFDIIRIAKALLLEEGAYGAVLSGSGPTVFGITRRREEAIAVKGRTERKLLGSGCEVLVSKTMKGAW
jgi:4-diphosphocytidyl-2-C-methyl-D-erythritol kinase